MKSSNIFYLGEPSTQEEPSYFDYHNYTNKKMKKVVQIGNSIYLDVLSKLGIGGAHPGGLDLTKELFKTVKMNSNSHILDVGCGTGQTAAFLASQYGVKVTGIDSNPIMVEKARSRIAQYQLPVEVIHGSIENCPIKDETFDFIISESVLSFVNKPRALKEIFRLLKNEGCFFANELTFNRPLTTIDEAEIKQFYGIDSVLLEIDWVNLFKQAGFKQVKIRKQQPIILQNHSMPQFQFSEHIDHGFYEVLIQHFHIMGKYAGILDYRVFRCTKF